MSEQRSFTCESCGGTFDAGPEDVAEAEYRAAFPDSATANVPRAEVCDDCYRKMMRELSPEDWERERRQVMERLAAVADRIRARLVSIHGEQGIAAAERAMLADALNGTGDPLRVPHGILHAQSKVTSLPLT